jgi:hypothetical protein
MLTRTVYRWIQHRSPVVGSAIALVLPIIIPGWGVQALTLDQVDAVASQITVIVAQGLQEGDIEARQEWNPGSGVLVARQGDTYYVLTALHVVRTRGVVYGVRTSDGEVHFVDDTEGDEVITPLGQEADELGSAIAGMDLALVRFTSDRDYPVAVMGDSRRMQRGDRTVVSGWPNPEDDTARRERRSTTGELVNILPNPLPDGGYSFVYDNLTRRGMSGGPVLNRDGELIGIHGRGRGGDSGCLTPETRPAPLPFWPRSAPAPPMLVGQMFGTRSPLLVGFHGLLARLISTEATAIAGHKQQTPGQATPAAIGSCGMQTVHFINAAEAARIALDYADPPVDETLIVAGLSNRDRADTVENIFEVFTFDVRSMLRDRPSGGCGSVLLGEPCDGGF